MEAKTTPIFQATDRWGELVVLTQEDWARITAKRPGVEGYEGHVQQAIEAPNLVYEGKHADSKVFYKKGLLSEDPLYWDCYVAVVVRYSASGPASIRTVYFPFHIEASLGTLLHAER